jgi:predicted RNase H-like HicB family nuclease
MWGSFPKCPVPIRRGATLDELWHNLKEVLALCLMELFQLEDIAWALERKGHPEHE